MVNRSTPVLRKEFLKIKRYISSRFSSNSEAFASELLDNLEEIFAWYYIVCDELNIVKNILSYFYSNIFGIFRNITTVYI